MKINCTGQITGSSRSCNWLNMMVMGTSVTQTSMKYLASVKSAHSTAQRREMGELTKDPLKNKDTLCTISEQIFLQLGMLHLSINNPIHILLWCSGSGDFWMVMPESIPPARKYKLIYSKINPPSGQPCLKGDSPALPPSMFGTWCISPLERWVSSSLQAVRNAVIGPNTVRSWFSYHGNKHHAHLGS